LGIAAFSLPAFAQNTPPHPGHGEQRHEMMAKRMADRQDKLKTALQLKPGQEAAWNAYATSRQPPQPLERPDPQAWSQLSTPQRLDKLQALKAERDAHQQRLAEATRALYTSLNADQQKVFDKLGPLAELRGPHDRGGMRHARQPGGPERRPDAQPRS
jgi:hypothetical protein